MLILTSGILQRMIHIATRAGLQGEDDFYLEHYSLPCKNIPSAVKGYRAAEWKVAKSIHRKNAHDPYIVFMRHPSLSPLLELVEIGVPAHTSFKISKRKHFESMFDALMKNKYFTHLPKYSVHKDVLAEMFLTRDGECIQIVFRDRPLPR